jgi:hypothetical protein
MGRRLSVLVSIVFVCSAWVTATPQSGDADKTLAAARAALGGDKRLAALKTLVANGQSIVVVNGASSAPGDAEFAFELPDKFVKKEMTPLMGNMAVARTSGFNGDTVINVVDQPPATGGMIQIRLGPGPGSGEGQTPQQQEEQRQKQLLAGRQDFARLALGMLASSLPVFPMQFSYGGQAESPDGKADIIDVKGDGDFEARLFIDTSTHLPLMLSWKAKEPIRITSTFSRGGPGAPAGGAGNVMVGAGQSHATLTQEDRDKMVKQAEERRREAEAKARIVEYRLYYGDYREVDGIKVPFRLQRSIDGKPSEELTLDKVKINTKIDPKKFEAK